MKGVVYVLHFSRPYYHARHYVGFTFDIEKRFQEHITGQGSPLVKAVVEAGIEVKIAGVLSGDRHLERAIKNQKNVKRICPCCREP